MEIRNSPTNKMEIPNSPINPMFDELLDENYILPSTASNAVDLFEYDLRNAFDNGWEMNNTAHTSSIPSSVDADVPPSSSNLVASSSSIVSDAVLTLGDDEVLNSVVSPSPDRSLLNLEIPNSPPHAHAEIVATIDGCIKATEGNGDGADGVNVVSTCSGFESDVHVEGVENGVFVYNENDATVGGGNESDGEST
ncbi:hypothetical protein OROGR_011440 [Orobanche gracilis]